MQYDVQFDDGTTISRSDAGNLIAILRECQEGRNWKKNDLMIIDNATTMHGKTIHKSDREILVTMGGTVKERSQLLE